jgi:hypothetical protein
MLAGAVHRIDEFSHRSITVFRMQPCDPVFVGVIGVRRQAVDSPVFGGPGLVSKAVPQVDGDGSHLGYLLKTGCCGV